MKTFDTILYETAAVQVRCVAGGLMFYAPPPVLALFAARIRGAESVIVPAVGHSAYWEQPELFNRAVLDFFGKHEPRHSRP